MLTHFSVTQQGERHIKKGTPCQDYSASRRLASELLDCQVVIAAVADGVGSCEFSQYGAETAVTKLLEYLERALLEPMDARLDDSVTALLEEGFRYALEQVEVEADRQELPFLELDTTLTGIVYDGKNLWFGHIGDDGIVALYCDGTYELVTRRHAGQEAHSVYPLRNVDLWQFGKAKQAVAACALMTDGVLDYCVDKEVMKNRVYFPFLEPALTEVMESDRRAEQQKEEWEAFFAGSELYADRFRDRVTDDISFVIVENPDAVAQLPEVVFDAVQWAADSARRKKELDDALYADYRAYKAERGGSDGQTRDDDPSPEGPDGQTESEADGQTQDETTTQTENEADVEAEAERDLQADAEETPEIDPQAAEDTGAGSEATPEHGPAEDENGGTQTLPER